MSLTQISRDPFARTTVNRAIVPACDVPRGGCDWCGQTRANGSLFKYLTESDGGRSSRHRGLFCSKSCHNSYHN